MGTLDRRSRQRQQDCLQVVLRRMRQGADLRQSDLAARIGEPQSFVSKYELGERRLDMIELRQICAALGVTLIELIHGFERCLHEAEHES